MKLGRWHVGLEVSGPGEAAQRSIRERAQHVWEVEQSIRSDSDRRCSRVTSEQLSSDRGLGRGTEADVRGAVHVRMKTTCVALTRGFEAGRIERGRGEIRSEVRGL